MGKKVPISGRKVHWGGAMVLKLAIDSDFLSTAKRKYPIFPPAFQAPGKNLFHCGFVSLNLEWISISFNEV